MKAVNSMLWAFAKAYVALACVAGCSGNTVDNPSDDSPTKVDDGGEIESWEQVRMLWAENESGGVFSLGFSAVPPDGLFISALAYLDEKSDYCAAFEEDYRLQASSSQSNWAALIHLSKAEQGRYNVTWDEQIGEEPTSQVMFKRIEKGVEKERHTALSGTVDVSEVPISIDEWQSGTLLKLALRVEVSQTEDREQGCSLEGSDEEPIQQSMMCTCEKATGATYTCERLANEPSCCFDPSGPREQVELTLRADQCAARCLTTGLLYRRYCQEL